MFIKKIPPLLTLLIVNIAAFCWSSKLWSQNLPPTLLPQAVTSYVVMDLETGQILDSLNIDEIQPVASVAKILTSIVALEQLGPDFRFETTVLTNAQMDQGQWQGDLILWGEGDPFLSSDDLAHLIQSLSKSLPLPKVGKFYYQDAVNPFTEINPLQPLAAAYNPGISPLSIDFNRVWVKTSKSLIQDAKDLSITETYTVTDQRLIPTPWITVIWPAYQKYRYHFLEKPLGPSSPNLTSFLRREEWQLPLSEQTHIEWLPVKHPAYHCASIFQELAAHQGWLLPNPLPFIRQKNQDLSTMLAGYRIIARHYSPVLSQIIPLVLQYSNNISAELIGYQLFQKSGSINGWVECESANCVAPYLRSWAQSQLPKLDWQTLDISQFSGLGHANHLTSRQMAAILKYLWDHPQEYRILKAGFTIPPFLSNSSIASFLQTKTGTLVGVSTIAGYILSSHHHPLAFFIASHNPQEINNLLVEAGNRSPFSTEPQREWQRQTRQFQKELLEYWFTAH